MAKTMSIQQIQIMIADSNMPSNVAESHFWLIRLVDALWDFGMEVEAIECERRFRFTSIDWQTRSKEIRAFVTEELERLPEENQVA